MPGFDQELLELRTAKEWHLTPAVWRAQPFDDRALMLAFELFMNTREAYRDEFMEKSRKDREEGRKQNPYQTMKAMMNL